MCSSLLNYLKRRYERVTFLKKVSSTFATLAKVENSHDGTLLQVALEDRVTGRGKDNDSKAQGPTQITSSPVGTLEDICSADQALVATASLCLSRRSHPALDAAARILPWSINDRAANRCDPLSHVDSFPLLTTFLAPQFQGRAVQHLDCVVPCWVRSCW